MSPKERKLLLFLAVVVLFGGGYLFYSMGIDPLMKKQKTLRDERDALARESTDLDTIQAANKRLKILRQQSLPKDEEVASREYELLLRKLVRDTGNRTYTVNYEPALSKPTKDIPLVNAQTKQPAYKNVVVKIVMPSADLRQLTDFLAAYYKVPLLQQITKLDIKRKQADLSEDKRPERERNDLDITILSTAIIADIAPDRKSVVSIPASNGAAMGGLGLISLEQTPRMSQYMAMEPIHATLAAGNRDYNLLAAKNVFFGTLPKPIPPAPPPKPEEEPPLPPKPDFSEFIKYTYVIHTYEGDDHVANIMIIDLANAEDYELAITQSGEKIRSKVKKYYYNGPTRRIGDVSDRLEVTNPNMINKNYLTIHGLDGDAIIVSEKPSLLQHLNNGGTTGTSSGGGRPGSSRGNGGGGSSSRSALPSASPHAALIGGLAVTLPLPEKYYRWELGKALSEMVELRKSEADKAIQRAQSNFLTSTEVQPPPANSSESTPPPDDQGK